MYINTKKYDVMNSLQLLLNKNVCHEKFSTSNTVVDLLICFSFFS